MFGGTHFPGELLLLHSKHCIVVESEPTRSLVAKLPQRSSLVVRELRAAGEERCEQGYRRVSVAQQWT